MQGTPTPVVGFLPIVEWEPFLLAMPDQEFASYLRRGIESGFRIGYDWRAGPPAECRSNLKSVQDNTKAVDAYIEAEVKVGKLAPVQRSSVHRSPIGLIPKPHQPGRFRLIVDLSAPKDRTECQRRDSIRALLT